jgi:replicative DNA helicase
VPDLNARAEEAFLGAIISDPRQLGDLQALRDGMLFPPLDASEFTDPARRAVWSAIARLREIAPGARGPEMTELILATSDDPLITRDYLTQLALSTPTPSAAAVYARMITEAALFRDLAAGGMPLGEDAADDPSAREITRYAANLTAARSAAADDLMTPGPPAQQDRAIREERFLGGLIGHQELIDWVAPDPDTFTSAGLREIYQAAVQIDRAGEPADPVTLAWAAARIVAQNDSSAGRATTPETLAEAIPPGTIARLATAGVAPLSALQAGRGLLADDARTQVEAQAPAARGSQPDIAASHQAAHAETRSQRIGSGSEPPLLHPPAEHQRQYGPQFTQDGN